MLISPYKTLHNIIESPSLFGSIICIYSNSLYLFSTEYPDTMHYDVLKPFHSIFDLLKTFKPTLNEVVHVQSLTPALLPSYWLIFPGFRFKPTPLKLFLNSVELNRTYFVSKNDCLLSYVA